MLTTPGPVSVNLALTVFGLASIRSTFPLIFSGGHLYRLKLMRPV